MSSLKRMIRAIASSPSFIFNSLKIILPLSIFFVKFLEWWYSPSSPARSISSSSGAFGDGGANAGPPVPPPRVLPPHPLGLKVDPTKYGSCPICGKEEMENATAAPSGYVFCYKCIYTEVSEKGKCPVTLLPVKIWELRKVLV
jgi:peroxin-12